MRKEAKMLLERSTDSLVLSIEKFNCPWDRGRQEITLLLLDRAFELLLKAAIIHKGSKIRGLGEKETFGHDKCVRVCLSDKKVQCLTSEQAVTIQIINSLRDAAQHYMLQVSEQQLYLYAQAGLTLYADLLNSVFGASLADHLPDRVLPASTRPPRDLHSVVKAEFEDVKALVAPGSRKHLEARAKLRPLAVIEASLNGVRSQPSESELEKVVTRIKSGDSWHQIFPGVATLGIATEATDTIGVAIRLTKKEGQPVVLVQEGTPGATTVAVKRVNETDYYSLGLKDLAAKVGLNQSRALALVRHLGIQDRDDSFKVIAVGGQAFKRYSRVALDAAREALKTVDMNKVWEMNRPSVKQTKGVRRAVRSTRDRLM
jgi:hypothetical protein